MLLAELRGMDRLLAVILAEARDGERMGFRMGRLWGVRLSAQGLACGRGSVTLGALGDVLYGGGGLDHCPVGTFSPGFSPLLPPCIPATLMLSRWHTGPHPCPPGGSSQALVLKGDGENLPEMPGRASCTPPPPSAPCVCWLQAWKRVTVLPGCAKVPQLFLIYSFG